MWGMEFDEDGNMSSVEWSPEFRKMIGYEDESDFPNKLESWSNLLHTDDKDAVLKEFNDTIQDYSGQKNYDVEYRLRTKSGEWRWFHAIGRLLRRENGVPLSYVGMFVDITENKEPIEEPMQGTA
jgi:PAS domain S-box-containing protein